MSAAAAATPNSNRITPYPPVTADVATQQPPPSTFASFLLMPTAAPSEIVHRNNSRPAQRRTWMLSCDDASSCPEVCGLLRERCWELDIDEYYATVEDGRRYALLHMERKVRATALERSIESLAAFGVANVRIVGFDLSEGSAGDDQRWFEVLERHLREGDARVVAWIKDGKRRPAMVFRPAPSRQLSSSAEASHAAATVLGGGTGVTTAAAVVVTTPGDAMAMMMTADGDDNTNNNVVVDEGEPAVSLAPPPVVADMVVGVSHNTAAMLVSTQREMELLVDLRMERKRASALERQLQELSARLSAAQERAAAVEQRQAARIDELMAEIDMMRREARSWQRCNEIGRAELALANAKLREFRADAPSE